MKTGILSIILAIVGIIFVIWFNYQLSELMIAEFFKSKSLTELSPSIFTNEKLYKLIAIGIGILGLILGMKSFLNKKWTGLFGIFLSIILIALTFAPLLNFFLSNSAFDINVI